MRIRSSWITANHRCLESTRVGYVERSGKNCPVPDHRDSFQYQIGEVAEFAGQTAETSVTMHFGYNAIRCAALLSRSYTMIHLTSPV